jgi:hypothetical protein
VVLTVLLRQPHVSGSLGAQDDPLEEVVDKYSKRCVTSTNAASATSSPASGRQWRAMIALSPSCSHSRRATTAGPYVRPQAACRSSGAAPARGCKAGGWRSN